jgi:4-hydroxy-2-oxoheptanedioate aldolase
LITLLQPSLAIMSAYLEQKNLHANASHRAALLTFPGNLKEALRQAQEDPKKALFGVGHGIPSVFLTKVCEQRGYHELT